VTTIKVTAKNFKFILSKKTAKRGVVIFKVTNTAAIQHDFSIKGRRTRKLSHGQSATLRVTFLRKGHYPYKCTVDSHASLGMKGVFTIT
jgi:plastocyanin